MTAAMRKGARTGVVRGALLAGLLIATGCGRAPAPGPRMGPSPPADEGTTRGSDADERLATVRARSVAVDRLQASLELTWQDPATDDPSGCSAFLVFDRTRGLRVMARSVAFVTVFELVADSARVGLDVAREKVTVTGPREDPDWDRLPASADGFLVALFADPWAGADTCFFREASGDGTVLHGDDWTLWLDPETGLPARYEREGLTIGWGEWAPRHGVPWPHLAEIRAGGGVLRARLGRLIVGRPGSPGQFTFEPPDGRELLQPAEAAERWNSGLEGFSGP